MKTKYLSAISDLISTVRFEVDQRTLEAIANESALPGDVVPNFDSLVERACLVGGITEPGVRPSEDEIINLVRFCNTLDWTLTESDERVLSKLDERVVDGQIEWVMPDGGVIAPAGGGRWHTPTAKWTDNLLSAIR